MKVWGSIEANKDIKYSGLLYQSIQKTNVVTDVNTETVFDTVELDLGTLNSQTIDLGLASTTSVNVEISNAQDKARYLLIFKQHPTSPIDVTFDVSIEQIENINFTMAGVDTYISMELVYTDGKWLNLSTNKNISTYDENTNYGIGTLVVENNTLYQAQQNISAEVFDDSKWQSIGSLDSKDIIYTDTNNIGETTVQGTLDNITSQKYTKIKYFPTVTDLLVDTINHNRETIYHVSNATDDFRNGNGYAFYIYKGVGSSISSYDLIGSQNQLSNTIEFDNTNSNIDNNPTNVQSAIDNMYAYVQSISSGLSLIGGWNSENNKIFIQNGGKYDDDKSNPTITSKDDSLDTLTFLTSDLESYTLSQNEKIQIRNGNTIVGTYNINSISSTATETTIEIDTDVTPILIGYTIITAETTTSPGQFLFVTNSGSNVTIDGESAWADNDRVMSNGNEWFRIPVEDTNVSSGSIKVDVSTMDGISGDVNDEASVQSVLEQLNTKIENNNGGVTTTPITVKLSGTKTVGKYRNNDVIPSHTSLQDLMEDISREVVNAVFNPGYANISTTQSTGSYEVGTTFNNVTFTATAVQRDSGAPNNYRILDGTNNELSSNNTHTQNITLSKVPQIFKSEVSFDAGTGTKPNNLNEQEPNNIGVLTDLSSNITYVGYTPMFFGAYDGSALDSTKIRLGTRRLSNSSNSFTFNTGTTHKDFFIWLPTNKSFSGVSTDLDALNANITFTNNGSMSILDVGGNSINGTLYTFTQDGAFTTNHRWSTTISGGN